MINVEEGRMELDIKDITFFLRKNQITILPERDNGISRLVFNLEEKDNSPTTIGTTAYDKETGKIREASKEELKMRLRVPGFRYVIGYIGDLLEKNKGDYEAKDFEPIRDTVLGIEEQIYSIPPYK